ncbi:hypothetical protein QO009_004061 [Brevibacillus aydinogluensis]|jgi:hypothetical protein|uniref:hypothetical protein n=1 Tax=Brevibacillus aydinogluensis TaxID=927786 RepID=UPI0028934424|nr:hypothetical protein [Brevibacillus aydinogluensis]MDT3418136.1 hypothetical protein [Brevibacillus aydinogluensis]
MKGNSLQVGLFTAYPQLDEWMIQQAEDAGFTLVSREDENNDFSGMSAILCFAASDPERTEVLYQRAVEAISQGLDVIWVVSGDGPFIQQVTNELVSKQQFVYPNEVDDATEIWQQVLSYYDAWVLKQSSQEEETSSRGPKLSIPILSKKSSDKQQAPVRNSSSRTTRSLALLDHVIAVAGHRGAGSSFVAWNVAALLGASLLEGNTTGTLAKWFEITDTGTREDFLLHNRGKQVGGVYAAATADRKLSEGDLYRLQEIPQQVVIDVGCDLQNPAWQYAGMKVFVATADPQWNDQPFPDDESIIRVMNRYPADFPSSAESVFNCKINLVIPECGREVLMSLYGLRPWILTQPVDVRDQWYRVFGKKYTVMQEQGGTKGWEESQFFS